MKKYAWILCVAVTACAMAATVVNQPQPIPENASPSDLLKASANGLQKMIAYQQIIDANAVTVDGISTPLDEASRQAYQTRIRKFKAEIIRFMDAAIPDVNVPTVEDPNERP